MCVSIQNHLRRLALPLVLICILGIAGGVLAQDNASRTLASGVPVKGTLNSDNPVQIYSFTGSVGQTISLNATVPGGGIVMTISDAAGKLVKQQSFEGTGNQYTAAMEGVTLASSGTYYVTVQPQPYVDKPSQGDFELTLTSQGAAAATPTVSITSTPPTNTSITPGQFLTNTGIQVTLTWNTPADLNLEVRDPVGGDLFWDSRTTPSGGRFGTDAGYDANGQCLVQSANPTETATWQPGAIPTGSYEILVHYRQACQNSGATNFTVNVSVNGLALPAVQGTLQPPPANSNQQEQVFVSSFVVAADGTTTAGANGIYGDTNSLPAPIKELAAAVQPVTLGTPVSGAITTKQPYQTFSFTGKTNDIVSVQMTRTSGSLDTVLLLLDSTGRVIDSNDDSGRGVTDSFIRNRTLPANGSYIIVATRYGKAIGGTEGNYQLALSGPTEDLPQAVRELNLPTGDIEVSLAWNTGADLQLLVRDPQGDSVFDDTPTSPSGGRLVANGNVNCTHTQKSPVSYIYWPNSFARPGSYEVEVWYQNQCNDLNAVEFTLNIVIKGKLVFTDVVRPLPNQRYVTNFTLGLHDEVTTGLGGFVGGSNTLDYQSKVSAAPAIIAGQTVTGNITPDNKFDVYTYDGKAGEVITIKMGKVAPSKVDTTLFLIDPNGNEMASNDDAEPNKTTDSLINKVTLPTDGKYIIVATHFATIYGGTTGVYSLTLTKAS